MNTVKTAASLVLACAATALSLEALDDAPRTRHAPWPPHPARIVDLSSEAAGAPATLQPGQLWSAYFVPPGSMLVVTNAAFAGSDMALVEGLGRTVELQRRGSDGPATLAGSGADPGAPLGWTFRPGSQVAFRNDASVAAPLDYRLVGYLADA